MFYFDTIQINYIIHPHNFDSIVNINDDIISKYELDTINGKCHIIKILKIHKYGNPTISNTNGSAIFKIKFTAICFNVYINEIIDGVVHRLDSNGIYLTVGPLTAFIHNKLMPETMKFTSDITNMYTDSNDSEIVINTDSIVRFKVKSIKLNSPIEIIGDIRGDFLGPI